jgi:LysM repeat protein
MEAEIPIQERLNLEELAAGDNIRVSWEMEDVSVHRINSRKLSLRAIVTFNASVEELYDIQAGVELHGVEELNVRTRQIRPLSLGTGKRDILRIKEEISLASNKPNIGEVLWESVQLRGTEVRVKEGELEVSGELFLFLLYSGEDEQGTKHWMETVVPFRGIISCVGTSPEMIPDVVVSLSGSSLEVRPDTDGEPRTLLLDAAIDLDIRIYQEEQAQILTDVYTPTRELIPVIRQETYESLVLRNFSKCRTSGRIRMEQSRPRMLQICHGKGEVQVDTTRITEKGIFVEGAIHINILYVTAEDTLPFARMEGVVPFSHTIEAEGMDGDCRFTLHTELEQLSTMMIDSEELEVKASVNLGVIIFRAHQEGCILQVEERPLDLKKIQKLPGLVAYLVQPGDTLWDIAKTYYTTPEKIRQQNELESEEVTPGDCILIAKEIVLIG